MKRSFCRFFFLFLFEGTVIFANLAAQPAFLQVQKEILSRESNALTLKIVCSPGRKENGQWLKSFVNTHFLFQTDSILSFPIGGWPFVAGQKMPRAGVLRSHSRVVDLPPGTIVPTEQALDDSSQGASPNFRDLPESFPNQPLISVREIGTFRDFPLWRLQVFPVKIRRLGGKAILFDTLVIRLDFASSGLRKSLQDRVENARVLKQLQSKILNPWTLQSVQSVSHKNRLSKTTFSFPRQRKMVGFKLLISEKGWYRVTASFLKNQHIPIEEIDWKNLAVHFKGHPVPVVAHGLEDGRLDPGDSFEFWGHPNTNTLYPDATDMYFDPYALAAAYVVTWDGPPGNRYASENGGAFPSTSPDVLKPRYFMNTVHAEKDQFYNRLGRTTPGITCDHWFWGSVGAGEIQNFPVDLPAPDLTSNRLVKVKIMLRGLTAGRHKIRAFLSNHRVLKGDWYDQTNFSLQTGAAEGIAGGQLDENKNSLTVMNDSENELDFFLINWFEVTYPRLYKAESDFIEFTRPDNWPNGRYQFTIDGFTNQKIEVFKLEQSQIFGGTVEEVVDSLNHRSYRLTFSDNVPSGQTTYIALTPQAKREPESAQIMFESTLKNRNNQADYLIITDPYFDDNEGLQKLAALREEQGLTVKMALTDEIYDLFSDGEKSPVGIKNFLTYVYQHWEKPAPVYVLLAGDGNYYVRSKGAQETNFVPVYHYQTLKFGASASDTWYTLISGNDLVPDYFIGRLPARTNAELNHMIDKIVAYETHPPNDPWRNRLLMIAGHDKFFHDQNAELAKTALPKEFLVQKFTAFPPNDPFFGTRDQLLANFNQGVSYANFMGHGGGAVWADNLLFRFDDVKQLQNGPRYPIVTSMTCFTAAFDSPSEVSCLGEQMLKLDRQGVVAFLGATGVGWVWNDYYFLRKIIHHLFVRPAPTVGAAITWAKIDYQAHYFTPQRESMVHQYNLLGDPALRPVFPRDSLTFQAIGFPKNSRDSLHVRVTSPLKNGQMAGTFVDSVGKFRGAFRFNYAGENQIDLPLPDSLGPGVYHVPVDLFAEDSPANFHGAIQFSVGRSALISLEHTPENIVLGDSVWISAQLAGVGPEAWVACILESPRPDSIPMKWKPQASDWSTIRPFLAQKTGLVTFHIAWTSAGSYFHSKKQTFAVNDLTDLRVVPHSILFVARDSLFLQATVQNAGAALLKNVSIVFWEEKGVDSLKIVETHVDFAPFETKNVRARAVFAPGEKRIAVEIDPNHEIQEKQETNNRTEQVILPAAFQFSPEKGFLTESGKTDSLCAWQNVRLAVSPRKLSRAFVLEFKTAPFSRFQTHQNFSPVQMTAWPDQVLIIQAGEEEIFADSVQLSIAVDNALLNKWNRSIFLFRYFPQAGLWARVPGVNCTDSVLSVRVLEPGAFAFLKSTDRIPPRVEISVGKRAFYTGGYVARNSEMSMTVSDDNGVYPSIRVQQILLDGTPVEPEKVRANFGEKSAAFVFSPQLSAGTHQLTVQAMDCAGNFSESRSVTCQVATNFDLRVLGNYPNPFRDKTVFVYELTAPATELTVKIFTVAGHLVRKIEADAILDDPDPLEAGYHEILWDGTDGDGEEIANGVYYFKFTAKSSGKTVKKIGKLARIK